MVNSMTWNYTNPIQPSPDENCDASNDYHDGFHDPTAFLVVPETDPRLIWPLRAAAQTDPPTMLALSTFCYAMATRPGVNLSVPVPPEPPFPPTAGASAIVAAGLAIVGESSSNRAALAQAFADLCASGRSAYGSFTRSPPNQATVASLVNVLFAGLADFDQATLQASVQSAFSRAQAVAGYLGLVQPSRAARDALGWIALSAEVDPPQRPVNISTLPYPQYNLTVTVPTMSGASATVEARYVVISDQPVANPEPVFSPTAHILLFIHGDGSRSEEVAPLVAPLLAAGANRGHPYTIIAVDLPSHGYSTMIDPFGPAFDGTPAWDNAGNTVGIPRTVSRPSRYAVLEFLENFVLAFVATLDSKYGIGEQFVGPLGGSLGGNMTLRLARANAPWIRCAMAWSPASIWNSLADDVVKAVGPDHCADQGHRGEDAGARADFFYDVFDSSTNIPLILYIAPQGQYWYRDDWLPCKPNILATARLERSELYNRIYRQFHYRMDWEQLLYSFNDNDPGSAQPRYASFRAHLLLAAGSEDSKSPATDIYDSARTLGQSLQGTNASGSTLFVEHTGHSMHDERPTLMANQIDAFIAPFDYSSLRQYLTAKGVPLPAHVKEVLGGRKYLRFLIQV
jgi:pimeloyl-ACP methyl ester carboxylesterase